MDSMQCPVTPKEYNIFNYIVLSFQMANPFRFLWMPQPIDPTTLKTIHKSQIQFTTTSTQCVNIIEMPMATHFTPRCGMKSCLLLVLLILASVPSHLVVVHRSPSSLSFLHVKRSRKVPTLSPSPIPTHMAPPASFPFYSMNLHLASVNETSLLSISSPAVESLISANANPAAPNSMPFIQFVKSKAVNNTVFVMIVDFGYLRVFLNSYFTSRLWEYPNLVILCLDQRSFNVLLNTSISPVDLESSSLPSVHALDG